VDIPCLEGPSMEKRLFFAGIPGRIGCLIRDLSGRGGSTGRMQPVVRCLSCGPWISVGRIDFRGQAVV
jgi:hypothetical protein